MAVYAFYHIFINEYIDSLDILRDQIDTIKKCGFNKVVNVIYCCITGNHKENFDKAIKIIEVEGAPFVIIRKEFGDKTYERYTLNTIPTYITERDKILYFHLKGSTRLGQTNITKWRKYLEYFTIECHQRCIELLDTYDACGPSYFLGDSFTPAHFSGNYWWCTGKHFLETYSKYSEYLNDQDMVNKGRTYCNPEFFILKNSCKIYSLYENKQNWYHGYLERHQYI